jgi:hypothetical protein
VVETNPYQSPARPFKAKSVRAQSFQYAPEYRSAVWGSLKWQAGVGVLTALMLCNCSHQLAVALVVQWSITVIVIHVWRASPPQWVLGVIKLGIIPIWIVALTLLPASANRRIHPNRAMPTSGCHLRQDKFAVATPTCG